MDHFLHHIDINYIMLFHLILINFIPFYNNNTNIKSHVRTQLNSYKKNSTCYSENKSDYK